MVEPTKKKRKYSKNGCTECKRKKVKCDETKPVCWQCSHLSLKCVYKTREFQFIVSKVPKKQRSTVESGPDLCKMESNKKDGDWRSKEAGQEIDTTLQRLEEDESFPKIESPFTPSFGGNDEGDLNALLNDALLFANDLFSKMPESCTGAIAEERQEPESHGNEVESHSKFNRWEDIEVLLNDVSKSELSYLKIFYDKVSYWLMPLAQCPDSNVCNHILFQHLIKVNSSNSKVKSYLQSSMVSISAKYVYNVYGKEDDNVIRKHFLKKALQQLYQEFESLSYETLELSQIDSLNLCVLLLTLDSSTFGTQEWKLHLRGAKDLLMKYNRNTEMMSGTSESILLHKRTVALARNWFSAIAAVASLAKGAHFFNETEVQEMLDIGANDASTSKLLKNMGFLTEQNFNTFIGYSPEALSLLTEVIKCLAADTCQNENNDTFLKICSLVQASREFQCYPNINGKLDANSAPPLSTVSVVFHRNSYYSVYDTLQQVHVELVFVTYLLKCIRLPESCSLIQNSYKRSWRMLEWMFSDCDLTIMEINTLIELLETGEIHNYSTLKAKLKFDLVRKSIIAPLLKDFILMMYQVSMLMSVARLAALDPSSLRLTRCKVLSYLLALADNLGAESARTSIAYLIREWYPRPSNLLPANEPDHAAMEDNALPFS
ncbi:unnamed protein product [Kluyveromyces dobzhanskii CBS 2104]|uniref:WGS project CCBQ000000000 data, contig 00099 n=1 Tax=Kluyveromyces dobzhanskii CBS 2104 TaxID=1427455 RepID=A0A0A8L483_9SACH|nr:unnamed protein product [Kluyveromyces dobzhanskii CBS 2104]